jgi:hypothetical protein
MALFMRKFLMATAVLAAASALAPAAWAGCGVDAASLKKHTACTGQEDAKLIPIANMGQNSIVGLWSVTMNLNGGGQFDWGYQVWHDDGTEIMNSGSRPPATGNFCMGAWVQTGPFSYHLNHYALSYDAGGTLNAKVLIKENVTVDQKGGTFSGPFTADIFVVNGPHQQLAGQIVGQRLTGN